ncbi:hyalin-like [Antedon mediterranea]|uniref:hyalin-like n=1 Tax=Antedon mediterranea TaxID=105859 RepID=UPI003AF6F59F
MDLIVDTVTGEAFAINVTWVEPTATDNSDETPIPVSDYTSGDMFALGNTTVQYNVSDSAGNFNDSCSFFVTVKDLETPSFNGTCPSSPLEVPTDPPTGNRLIGEMFATVIWTIPSATDNVGVVMVTNNSYPGSPVYFNISSDYDMNVAYAAQDAAGNVAICSFLVKVVDEEPPVFYTCDNSTVYINNTAGENFAPYTWMEPANADNILVDSERSTPNFAPGQDFTVGENYIIYINYDTSGNQNSCNFTLVVVDIEDPAIANCPNNTASITDNGKNYSNITWTPEPTATDNDGVVSFEKTHNSGDLFYFGVTTVNYTAVDHSGNVAICLFNITLTDLESPEIIDCPMDSIVNTTTGEASVFNVTWMVPTATDNSGETPVPVADYTSGDNMFGIGTTAVQYNVSDSAGNFNDSCTFVIHVEDQEAPDIFNCPMDLIVDTATGEAFAINVTWVEPTATDNSDETPIPVSDYTSGDMFALGNTTVQYNVSDSAVNFNDSCSFSVTVKDLETPSFNGTCPSSPLEVPTDPPTGNRLIGEMFATVIWTIPSATDNVGVVMVTNNSYPGSPVYFNISSDYDMNVAYAAQDAAGNVAICSFFVKVVDEEPPVFYTCDNSTVYINNTAGENFAPYTWMEPANADNILVDSERSTPNFAPGQDFTIGENYIIYINYDTSGNQNSCNFTLVVVDIEDPAIANCPNNTASITDNGKNYSNITWTPEPTATDNDGVVSFEKTHNSGDLFYLGVTTVNYTAVDPSGNVAICLFNITLTDLESPEIIDCPMDSTTTTGEASVFNVTWIVPTATDNSGETPVPVADYTSGDNMFGIGTTTVQYNVSDSAGNFNDSCTFVIHVEDNERSIIDCPTNVTSNNYIGGVSGLINIQTDQKSPNATVTWDPPVTSGNGTVTVVSSPYESGDMIPIGTHTIIFTATDLFGNNGTCDFVIKVEGSIGRPAALFV